MAISNEKVVIDKSTNPQLEATLSSPSVHRGDLRDEDAAIRDFYGDAVSETYRLKSELVAEHLAEIGMGK